MALFTILGKWRGGGGALSLCVSKLVSLRKDCNIFNRREHDLNDNNLSVTTKKR